MEKQHKTEQMFRGGVLAVPYLKKKTGTGRKS